jgi:hypothetical protein
MRNAHPVEMIDSFVKDAQAALAQPYGMGDSQRASEGYNRRRQEYSQPNPPTSGTVPDLVTSQKAVQSPPVM